MALIAPAHSPTRRSRPGAGVAVFKIPQELLAKDGKTGGHYQIIRYN